MFIVNSDDEVDGTNDAGVALWRTFNYIAKEHDVLQAFISVTHVSLCTSIIYLEFIVCFLYYYNYYYINISKCIKNYSED